MPEGRDHRKINAISHGDDDVAWLGIHRLDFRVVRWIDFPNAGTLIDDLGLVITKTIHLVGKFFIGRPAHDDTHQFLASKLHASNRHRVRTDDADRRTHHSCNAGP